MDTFSKQNPKTCDVFGVGHALLDLEYYVKSDFIQNLDLTNNKTKKGSNKIKKGRMSLIGYQQQQTLREKLNNIAPRQMIPGGSAANSLFLLKHLGSEVYFHANLGQDAMGKHYKHCLEHSGLNTNIDNENLIDGSTGLCVVMITPDAERTMLTHLGVSDKFELSSVDLAAIRNSKYLYIEGYLVTSPIAQQLLAKMIETAYQSGTKIAITLSDASLVTNYNEVFHQFMTEHKIDLLFCNQHEACAFAKTQCIEQAKKHLKKFAQQFTITLGEKGSCLYDENKFHLIQGKKVNAINTLGAGDMYAGAFLYAINNGHTILEAANFANEASAQIVTKHGPRLTHEEAQDLLHKLRLKIKQTEIEVLS